MRIALTGGSGGVGSAVADAALARGHFVVSVDRTPPPRPGEHPRLRYIQAEATDYDALVAAFAGCDALIHLAAIPHPGNHPDHVVHNNNVVGSYNAMRAAVESGVLRICQASSVNAIGQAYSRAPRYDYFPIDEAHPNHAEDAYSLSKWVCEQQADALARRYAGLSIASLRFHWVLPDRETAMARYASRAGGWTGISGATPVATPPPTPAFAASRPASTGTRSSTSSRPTRPRTRRAASSPPGTSPMCRSEATFRAGRAS